MFNNNGPITPQMQDRTKGTYAETKAEIEARKRAELAAQQAMLSAQNAPKKTPWLAILTILFAVIAVGAAGFAVYLHAENDKLSSELEKANSAYTATKEELDSLEKQNKSLTEENAALKKELDSLQTKTGEEPAKENIEK